MKAQHCFWCICGRVRGVLRIPVPTVERSPSSLLQGPECGQVGILVDESQSSGQWSATGLRDAMQRYSWNGQDFLCNEEELTALSRKLQSAIKRCCNDDVGEVAREIMRWGGVDSVHRQKRTFAWIAVIPNRLLRN